jgi:membrane fusion protein (multidrug efflux system)
MLRGVIIVMEKAIKIISTILKLLGQQKLTKHKLYRPMAKMMLAMFLLFGAIFSYKFIKIIIMPRPTPPLTSVSSMIVKSQEWQSKIRAVGTMRAIQGVNITTELAGMIKKIHFVPGSKVKTDDLLLELNADAEIAQRDSLKALVDLAEITYKRDKAQFAVHAISKATLDFDKADLDNKRAQLSQQEAIVAKKFIRAPFSGYLGISNVNLGQYLNTGDKIVTLQALDPIYVDFTLPQQALRSVKVGQKVNLKVDTYPNEIFTGEITSIDPKVDPATRNIQIEATISNPDMKLYPGMFGEVEIHTGVSKNALVLPKTAISFNPFGEIVYVIHESGKDKAGKPMLIAKQSFVTVGESRGEEIVVLKGVKEGDQVVIAGQLKLKNGTAVVINNTVLPDITPQEPHNAEEMGS